MKNVTDTMIDIIDNNEEEMTVEEAWEIVKAGIDDGSISNEKITELLIIFYLKDPVRIEKALSVYGPIVWDNFMSAFDQWKKARN